MVEGANRFMITDYILVNTHQILQLYAVTTLKINLWDLFLKFSKWNTNIPLSAMSLCWLQHLLWLKKSSQVLLWKFALALHVFLPPPGPA